MADIVEETVDREQSELIRALEDERYQWRTVDGLVKDLEIARETIEDMLVSMKQTVVRSSIPDERGRSLFTTRRHYKQTHGFGDRLLAALADRVAAVPLDKVA